MTKLNMELINAQVDFYNKKRKASNEYKLETEHFIDSAKRYIKAIKETRMICDIGKVSKSGMSRNIKFLEMARYKTHNKEIKHTLWNFYQFFEAMEFTPVKDSDYFRIGGCGMDMIFHTNYTIIHRLTRMGFLNKQQCATLAQATPAII